VSLFQLGNFTLASGAPSAWKIECDALTAEDWDCLAFLGLRIVPSFGSVVGVPRGGLPFARAMSQYVTSGPRLIVDDVFTTGGSLLPFMDGERGSIALVAFARNPTPPWLYTIFQCSGGVT
jgi:orotate phosphoribosyltransferase